MTRKQSLALPDLLVAAAILFGPALASSLSAPAGAGPVDTAFTLQANLIAFGTQAVQLGAALLYLRLRGYEPFPFAFRVSGRSLGQALALFCLIGLVMDLAASLHDGFGWIPQSLSQNIPLVSALAGTDPSLVLFSLLNGFYEEFFFLGLCMAAKPRARVPAIVLALAVRILIHTYQGMFTALALSLDLGLIFLLLYERTERNLFVFALAHALADIVGLSLVGLL